MTSAVPRRVYRDHPLFRHDRPPSVIGRWEYVICFIEGPDYGIYWQRVDEAPPQMTLATDSAPA